MADTSKKPTLRETLLSLKADPHDPREIAARAYRQEKEAAVNALIPQYENIGCRLANGEPLAIGSDVPMAAAVLYEFTGGKQGAPPGDLAQTSAALLLAMFMRTAYEGRLAERYIEEAGIALVHAPQLRVVRPGMMGPVIESLSDDARAEFFRADELLLNLSDYCDALAAAAPSDRDAVEVPPALSDDDVAEARELVENILGNATWIPSATQFHDSYASYMEHPAARKAIDTFRQFRPLLRDVTPEEAEAVLVRVLSAMGYDPATRPPTPREWLAQQGRESELQALEDGIVRLASEETRRQLAEAQRERDEERAKREALERQVAEIQHKPLRLGTRAVKAHTARSSDYVQVLRTLRRSGRLSPKERKLLEREELVALRGDELLVSAGLLEIARQDGALRVYGPARARMGAVVFDARIVIGEPSLEQVARLVGFKPGAGGRVPSADRERVETALAQLCNGVRPIVVESTVMHGKKWRAEFEIVRDVPVRRGTRADGSRVLEIHGSLALGYWWGHVLLSPQKWEAARQVIGARYTDDAMKWADVYFRRLVLGVASEHKRKSTPAEQLAAGLPKRLKTAALLEELELEAYRTKEGATKTAKRLAKTFDFCVAAGSLVAWEPDGTTHYRVTLPHPVEAEPAEVQAVQAEIFPMLPVGESYGMDVRSEGA